MMRRDRQLVPTEPMTPAPRIALARFGQSGGALESAELLTRARIVVRRRWPSILIVFVVVMIGVVVGSLLRDPMYRASGTIEISASRTGDPVETLFEAKRLTDDAVNTEVGVLKSDALAGRVVDTLGLTSNPEFAPDPAWPWQRAVTPPANDPRFRQRVINRFRQMLDVDPQQDSRLVTVSFEAHDPQLAAQAVNGVLDAYVRRRLDDAKRSAGFLSTQIAEAQRQLEASERRLQQHVRQRGLQIIETGKGETENLVNDRLRQLHQQLADVQVDRYQKQSAFEMASNRDLKTIDDPVIQNLTIRLADLEREYASLSTTFTDEYPKVQQVKDQIKQIRESLDGQAKRSLERLNTNYQAALRRESLLQGALAAQQGTAVALTTDAAGYETLKREVLTNQQMYAALDQKLKELTISAALKSNDIDILDRAAAPLQPSTTPLPTNIALGVVVSLFLALGFAFLREHLDRSVRSLGEVDMELGVPALAAIPAVQSFSRGSKDRPLLATSGEGAVEDSVTWARIDKSGRSQDVLNEAFAALRTSVVLADSEAPPCRLLVTSSRAGEGKTTIAINLAISLARLSERVLLIDADLRHPRVHQALGLEGDPGLSTWLVGGRAWRECLQQGPLPNLDVLSGGKPTLDGPNELTSSPLLRRLLDDAQDQYDFIVLDSPSVLTHPADVRMLAALADGTLLTVRSGSTPREIVWEALAQLRHTLGIVLNGLPLKDVPHIPPGARFSPSEE